MTVFGGSIPDLTNHFVHFTGRPRTWSDQLPAHAPDSPEARLACIIREGVLRPNRTFGTRGPVVCISELTVPAIGMYLSTGATWRGRYEPWAIVLDRAATVDVGFRPIWNMSPEDLHATSNLPSYLADRRVRYIPGSNEWLHEREWRLCWGDSGNDTTNQPGLTLSGRLSGVITGRPQWNPSEVAKSCEAAIPFRLTVPYPVKRLFWDGTGLVDDGEIDPLPT